MHKHLASDRYRKLAGPRKIGLSGFSGAMVLRQFHILLWTFGDTPTLYLPLQGPQLSILISIGILRHQLLSTNEN
jgi:hypothetical protein